MEDFLASVRYFAGNFAPKGYLQCSGQLLSIAQWSALFSLVGTTFGGDGVTTFALPKLEPLATANGGTLLPIICVSGYYPSRAD